MSPLPHINWVNWQTFSESCLALSAAALVCRKLIWNWLEQSPIQFDSRRQESLAPAEFAYLIRQGDMAHTMLVLAVDLMHKAIKGADGEHLQPYERQAWQTVTGWVKQKGQDKLGQLVPFSALHDPWQWLLRLKTWKALLGKTFKQLVGEVIKDPRHLKRYFSVAGIGQLAVALYTSALRPATERQLKDLLSARGLLIAERRQKQAQTGSIGLLVLLALSIAVSGWYFHPLDWPTLCVAGTLALASVILARLIAAIPSLLPSFDQFQRLTGWLERQSWRINLVRWCLSVTKVSFFALAIVPMLLYTALPMVFFSAWDSYRAAQILLLTASLQASSAVFLILAIDCHQFEFSALPTGDGKRLIRMKKEMMAAISPLNTFKDCTTSTDYDPTLSEIVALYGIETLWLLS